jgi:hypothetical protein
MHYVFLDSVFTNAFVFFCFYFDYHLDFDCWVLCLFRIYMFGFYFHRPLMTYHFGLLDCKPLDKSSSLLPLEFLTFKPPKLH